MLGAGILSLPVFAYVGPAYSQEDQDCVNCGKEDEPECQRVVQGNKVHIFYGEASPC